MQEELLAADLASAVRQMAAAGRYGELLLLADTCQVRHRCCSEDSSGSQLGCTISDAGPSPCPCEHPQAACFNTPLHTLCLPAGLHAVEPHQLAKCAGHCQQQTGWVLT